MTGLFVVLIYISLMVNDTELFSYVLIGHSDIFFCELLVQISCWLFLKFIKNLFIVDI